MEAGPAAGEGPACSSQPEKSPRSNENLKNNSFKKECVEVFTEKSEQVILFWKAPPTS